MSAVSFQMLGASKDEFYVVRVVCQVRIVLDVVDVVSFIALDPSGAQQLVLFGWRPLPRAAPAAHQRLLLAPGPVNPAPSRVFQRPRPCGRGPRRSSGANSFSELDQL